MHSVFSGENVGSWDFPGLRLSGDESFGVSLAEAKFEVLEDFRVGSGRGFLERKKGFDQAGVSVGEG